MKLTITARPLYHRGESRIKVEFSQKDWPAISKVKSIPGRKWSRTHECWHIPHTEDALRRLKNSFGEDLEIQGLEPFFERTGQARQAASLPESPEPASFQVVPSAQLKHTGVSTRIQPEFHTITRHGAATRVVVGSRLVLLLSSSGWIQAFVPYDKSAWIEHIRNIPGRRWDSEQCCWLLPMTAESIQAIQDFFGALAAFGFAIPKELPERWGSDSLSRQEPEKPRLNERQRKAITALEEQLILEGKRHRTIKSYRGILTGLLLHYPKAEPSKITLEQINAYLVYKKKSAGISASTHNQIINAVNAYFGRVLNQNEKVQKMVRPRKQRQLPNVLSKKEVERLLQAVSNLKHKSMLILIYSAGLRKSEVLNLRARDLDFSRQCIFVKDSKGGKDRYTLFSPKAIGYLEEYIRTYKPRFWLFEGQTGGQYSETSLQSIFERAKEQSGINPFVTLHGLRHSFATHLVEQGASLHEVKKLLGHEHIKTTEIYLHLAKDFFRKIRSPLDGLDL